VDEMRETILEVLTLNHPEVDCWDVESEVDALAAHAKQLEQFRKRVRLLMAAANDEDDDEVMQNLEVHVEAAEKAVQLERRVAELERVAGRIVDDARVADLLRQYDQFAAMPDCEDKWDEHDRLPDRALTPVWLVRELRTVLREAEGRTE
jgi:hypothetical protein